MAVHIFQRSRLHNYQTFLIKQSLSKEKNEWGRKFKSSYFVTTPIFYVNADPHIGHLYTSVIADTITRFEKLQNPDVQIKFMSGTDEHGLKISQSAKKANLSPLVYCNTISEKFRKLFRIYHISATDFLRTTEERHKKAVTLLWEKLAENGLIYKAEYAGWYCVADEAFMGENELNPTIQPDGSRVTIDNKPVEYIKEDTYKFKLHSFKNDLLHWLNSGDVVKPLPFKKLLESWIHNDSIMQDLSISRPVKRVEWGIPVPNDPSQSIYVWLDALTCYLTTNGYPENNFKWPPDLQIVGKDILKFHGIFWPAFLIGANLEPPKCILCHSHWIKDGEKMSKSKGNVIDPIEKYEDFSCDGFRYYMLRTGSLKDDSNFVESTVIEVLNAELANTFGNLLSRTVGHSVNKKQIFPSFSEENHNKYCKKSSEDLINALRTLPDEVIEHYRNFDFHKGINSVMDCLRLGNRMIDVEQPWVLKKDPSNEDHLDAVLHIVCEALRVCGILIQPVIPNISCNLLNKLSIPENERNFCNIRPYSWEKSENGPDIELSPENTILFRRIKTAQG